MRTLAVTRFSLAVTGCGFPLVPPPPPRDSSCWWSRPPTMATLGGAGKGRKTDGERGFFGRAGGRLCHRAKLRRRPIVGITCRAWMAVSHRGSRRRMRTKPSREGRTGSARDMEERWLGEEGPADAVEGRQECGDAVYGREAAGTGSGSS